MRKQQLTILGSGPAGLTAAIYAARAGLKPLVIHGSQAGGQLTITTMVENYPGFADGVLGPDLMSAMQKQAERFGTEFILDVAESVDLSKRPFVIKVGGEVIETEALIIASGASPKLLGLQAENKLMGRGVSVCATCDGFFFKGKKVFVIGGGDAALEEAISLTRFADSVTVIHRRDQFRASKIMIDRARSTPKLGFVLDSVVEEIHGVEKNKVTGIKVKNVKTGAVQDLPADGVFIAIGHIPNTSLFKGELDMNEHGYLATTGVKTKIEGVFAAGDAQDDRYRQAVYAAGNGCAAALEAQWFIESHPLAKPVKEVPAKTTAEATAPVKEVPATTTAEATAPVKEVPATTTAEATAPVKEVPATTTAEPTAPVKEVPAKTTAEPTAPVKEVPAKTTAEATAPVTEVPATTTAEATAPVTEVPAKTAPEATASVVEVPAETQVVKESKHTVDVLPNDFDSFVQQTGTFVVDFWAEWCGPCRAIAPKFEALAADYAGRLVLAKVDLGTEMTNFTRFDLFGIPTLALYKNGKEIKRMVGHEPVQHLKSEFDQLLVADGVSPEFTAAKAALDSAIGSASATLATCKAQASVEIGKRYQAEALRYDAASKPIEAEIDVRMAEQKAKHAAGELDDGKYYVGRYRERDKMRTEPQFAEVFVEFDAAVEALNKASEPHYPDMMVLFDACDDAFNISVGAAREAFLQKTSAGK